MGNLIAALILGKMSQSTYYVVMSVAALTGSLVFLFLKKPIKGMDALAKLESNVSSQNNLITEEERQLSKAQGDPSDSMILIKKEQEERDKKRGSATKDIKDTFNLLISPRMLFIMPLILWTAMS